MVGLLLLEIRIELTLQSVMRLELCIGKGGAGEGDSLSNINACYSIDNTEWLLLFRT